MPDAGRPIPTSRWRRAAKVGRLAATQAAKQTATRAANVARSEEAGRVALEKRQIEAADVGSRPNPARPAGHTPRRDLQDRAHKRAVRFVPGDSCVGSLTRPSSRDPSRAHTGRLARSRPITRYVTRYITSSPDHQIDHQITTSRDRKIPLLLQPI